MQHQHYRQGDVLLCAVKEIPKDATDITPKAGPIVLAFGSSTGHSHAIDRDGVRMFSHDDRRFLDIEKATEIKHEEHTAIAIPAGKYETRDVAGNGIVQTEYEPGALRTVED